jgi:UDP-N-acetylglucosamine 2-epimerase (non-hydrolysing)
MSFPATHLLHVVGARPNFMKAAPLLCALEKRSVCLTLVHSGQHYDRNMSDVFFDQLGMRAPDVNLQVGSGSHAQQTAAIMSRFEPVLLDRKPDMAIVYGDVNSTTAVALVCAKLGVPFVHVESGLRSFDRTMPEEINRIVTDHLADLLLTPSSDANENLLREGIAETKIHLVGNIMIDTLVRLLPAAEARYPTIAAEYGLDSFALVTLHRPSNVDDIAKLAAMVDVLDRLAADLTFVFPVHPRTRERLKQDGLQISNVKLVEPLPYIDFLALQKHAIAVVTDSGGVQEETTYLGVPCLTMRENTERPITVSSGTNRLIGNDLGLLERALQQIVAGAWKSGSVPPLWDGHTAERIADLLVGTEERALAAAHR